MEKRKFLTLPPLIVFLTIFGCGGGGSNPVGTGGNGNGSVASVEITPEATSVGPGGTKQFTAKVNGTTDQRVVWSMQGDGNITADGLYTANTVAGVDEVIATSVADPTKSDRAEVKIVTPK